MTEKSAAEDTPFRVVVIDDVLALRQVVRAILQSTGRFEVVGEAGDAVGGVQLVRRLKPDIVLVDVNLPDMLGWEAVPELRRLSPKTKIVILSGAAARAFAPQDVLKDVSAVLDKGHGSGQLVEHLLEVMGVEPPPAPEPPRIVTPPADPTPPDAAAEATPKTTTPSEPAAAPAADTSDGALERFARVAAHDLSQPLQVAYGYLELLRQEYGDTLDERAGTWVESVLTSLDRMRILLRAIVRYSRLAATERTTVEMAGAFDRARKALDGLVTETGAEVKVSGELPTVTGDGHLIELVFHTLLENALTFRRPDTAPVVTVDTERSDGLWLVAVRDNGIGVPADRREVVFEPFERSGGAGSGRPGLGLALARKAVAAHGGRIWIDDNDGGGVSVVFTLPAT